MVVFSDASNPVKPLNGLFSVFFFHVALGCKNGENASSVVRVCIKLVFHASSVVLDCKKHTKYLVDLVIFLVKI